MSGFRPRIRPLDRVAPGTGIRKLVPFSTTTPKYSFRVSFSCPLTPAALQRRRAIPYRLLSAAVSFATPLTPANFQQAKPNRRYLFLPSSHTHWVFRRYTVQGTASFDTPPTIDPVSDSSHHGPNPKCRLYWCLIEFIDWRYSQSC